MLKCDWLTKKKCYRKVTHKVLHYTGQKIIGHVCKKHRYQAGRWWELLEVGSVPKRRCLNLGVLK